jgi:hypothetical protein
MELQSSTGVLNLNQFCGLFFHPIFGHQLEIRVKYHGEKSESSPKNWISNIAGIELQPYQTPLKISYQLSVISSYQLDVSR